MFQLDKTFVQAVAKHDHAALSKILDNDFLWTDASGETLSRAKVLAALPVPMIGDETGTEVSERSYGEVAGIQVANGKQHVVRIWVKRSAGWRLLDYQEVKQVDDASARTFHERMHQPL